jgi:hypothetical protein
MQEQFIEKGFRDDSLAIITQANRMAADYRTQGYSLSLRQLYYLFVSKDLLANSQQSYKRLGSIINDARLAGLLDWSYLEDRGREVHGSFGGHRNPGSFLDTLVGAYSEAIWQGQEYRPEVWVEKDALSDVIARGCQDTRTPYLACKGYMSQSEMYAAAKRIERRRRQGLTPIIIHLGDHDPSGIDMSRDIQDRLSLMSWGHVEVRRIALNMDQVEQYDPPPNPAKLTDSRGTDYVDRFGNESWELDALEPTVLVDLIQNELATIVDQDLMNERLDHEAASEARLRTIVDRWDDLENNWGDVLEVIGE